MVSPIDNIRAAYKQGRKLWSGCSWPTHYGCLGLNLDGVSSRQARQTATRWLAIAGEDVAGDEFTADDENSLVNMALHMRLGHGAVCLGTCPGERRVSRVCGRPAVRFCAEALAREWESAASWLEEIEADALWASKEARQAVCAAEEGDWEHALGYARHACLIESSYDDPRPWARLREAIKRASR